MFHTEFPLFEGCPAEFKNFGVCDADVGTRLDRVLMWTTDSHNIRTWTVLVHMNIMQDWMRGKGMRKSSLGSRLFIFPVEFSTALHLLLLVLYILAVYSDCGKGLTDRCVIPGGGKICLSSPKRPDRLWDSPSLPFSGYRSSSLGIKRLGREVNHSPGLGKNGAITLLCLYYFMAWRRKTLPLLFTLAVLYARKLCLEKTETISTGGGNLY